MVAQGSPFLPLNTGADTAAQGTCNPAEDKPMANLQVAAPSVGNVR
jgi:hypothetical protein